MNPHPPLDYAPPPPKSLGVTRGIFLFLGLAWFAFWALIALVFIIFRGLADEPGSPMTFPRALGVSARLLVFGLPGLATAWFIWRRRRVGEQRA
jgi:hypothetical protein